MKPSSNNVILSMCCTMLAMVLTAAGRADDAAEKKAGGDAASQAEASAAAGQPKTHKVKPQRLRSEVALKGIFESTKMSPVSVRPESWSSLVVQRAADHGKYVKKGDLLVQLETDKLDEAIGTAEHALHTAKLALRQGEADLKLAEEVLPLELKSAELAKHVADESLLDFVKVDRERNITSAKRSLDSSRFALESVQEELNQLKKMYEADDLTEETEEIILKRAERSVDSSKYALESAEIRTARRLEREIPRTEQQLVDAAKRQGFELQRAKITLPAGVQTKQLALQKLRLDVDNAARKLNLLKKDRQLLSIKSPADGIVYYGRCVRGKWLDKTKADAMLKPGGSLLAKQTFLTVVARQPLQIRVDLAEANLWKVRKGIAGTATPVGFTNLRIPTSVKSVSHVPLGSGIFDCSLSLPEGANLGPVTPGMTCQVKLVTFDKKDALTVPPAAVHEDQDDPSASYVFLVTGDKPKRRKVVVGHRGDKQVEIVGGLKAGDEVLLGKPK